jgi:ligand-binding sensor domain-containing protein/signal transduction histidine kinase
MKTLLRIIAICWLLPASGGELSAQSGHSGFKRLFRTYTTRDGLAQLQVRSLAMDAYGQVWVGTQNGLSRFDGERIVSYGRQQGLPRGTITDLVVDGRQRVWGATRSELFVFDGMRARVFPLPGEPSQPTLVPLGDEGLLLRREIGVVYFRDSSFFPIDAIFPFLDNARTYEVTQIDPVAKRLAVFEEGGKEIWLIDPDGRGHRRVSIPEGFRVHLAISADRRPWVDLRSSASSLICGLARDSMVPVIRVTPPGLMDVPESLRISVLRNDLAPPFFPFATKKGGGLWALDRDSIRVLQQTKASFRDPYALGQIGTEAYRLLSGLWFNTINDLVIDERGRLCMATERGLLVMDLPGWERLDGLPCDNPWSVAPLGGADTLLVGCHRGGVQRMGREGQAVRTIGFGGDPRIDHQVFPGLACNVQGEVFFGGYRGVYQWLANGKVRHWPAAFTVEALLWDARRGRLLCAGKDLYEACNSERMDLVAKIPVEISQHVSCTALALGQGDEIWLAGWGGVGRLDERDGWRLFQEREGRLPFESAFSLLFDGQGRLWCGGSEGLAVLQPGENAFRPVHPEIFRDQVSQVLFLGTDTLIVVGSKECSILDVRSDPPRMLAHFDHRTNYDLLEPAENGASLDGQGYLWVAAASGIHRLKISDLRERRTEPPIILIDQVNGAPVLQEDLRQPGLAVDGDRVIIHYRVLGEMASRAMVSYRLPNEAIWRPAGQGGVLILDGLSHGRQRIALRAELPGWTEEGEDAVLDLQVRIPFLQRPWPQRMAWATGIVLLLLALSSFYQQWRSRNQLRRLQQRIGQARLKTIQAQLNPHFLFNAMISLQHTIRHRSPDEASSQLVRLSRLIRQVLDFSAGVGTGREALELTPLDRELSLLMDYVRLEQEQRDPGFDFVLEIDSEVEEENPEVPPLLIQPFVENAIQHGLSPLKRSGWIRLAISRVDERTLRYVIEDDGVGREAVRKPAVPVPSAHRSLGMSLIEERISILGDLGHPCRLQVSDRDPSGTRVEIQITIAHEDSDH